MDTTKNIVKLQQEELNIEYIIDLVTASNCGAISNFIGITRDNFDNKKVLKLEYEAYEPMALKEMNNICSKIRSQWNVHHIAIYHRLGEVPVSKASVVIAISSPHREESLKAVEYAINALKSSVPIWKKEIYDTQEMQWKENKECAWSNIHDAIDFEESENITITNEIIETTVEYDSEEEEEKEESKIIIDPNLVQIRASSNELNHRISAFIERKRQQVNIVNVQEFCCHRDQNDENEDSCARVDAILIRRKDSKSHVKVHRVLNTWGPQTVDQHVLHKVTMSGANQINNYSSVLDERISTTEKILGINRPVPKDVYERLKNIEDRILYLEGISPEYKNLWKAEDMNNLKGTFKPIRKRTYSMAELDSKLHELEDKYAKRAK
ncbi:molybdopterin synthase catalytic subunit isoform X2 [Apis laboriosa]|nr:molybdopterin synthase catalytic subunit isoform X2 [Apis laboriosa]XP_043793175.1 molybdopterin synthase catalytic subunit isoform X2 [Apis laboriosa]XP_043793176.1 molybdopterin synthase catalytic subunit isoform X2 [Apis laboriosa]